MDTKPMDINPNATTGRSGRDIHCAEVPEFKRLRYFYGQMLGVHDFQSEQNYFRDKLKLHNRCLHGFGIGCGLLVVPAPVEEDCLSGIDKRRRTLQRNLRELALAIADAKDEPDRLGKLKAEQEMRQRELDQIPAGACIEEKPTRVTIECGFALDCNGNEIVVRHPLIVDLWHYLDDSDRRRMTDGATSVYLSICYCEQPVDPVRPVMPDACGGTMECAYGKLRDAVRIKVTVDPPCADLRCETCCSPCEEACLLLARIKCFRRNEPVTAGDIDNSVRRPLSVYPPTTITGISWTHGAVYSRNEAAQILGGGDADDGGSEGFRVAFSRPVLTSTLVPGVVDIHVIEGGKTRRAGIYHLEGEFHGLNRNERTTREFGFRYTGDENLDPGDRVHIVIRCAFILDECCRPVDGAHVGGRVPILEMYRQKFYRDPGWSDCVAPPSGDGPWTSGAGTPGACFESWFYLEKSQKDYRNKEDQK